MTEFVNPYNFIPFEKGGPSRLETENIEAYKNPSNLLSGWMDVILTPKTKLIITDGIARDENGVPCPKDDIKIHKKYLFYRLPVKENGKEIRKLAIPGSSLRGMIRSVYEAASNSCLPFLLDDEAITIRTPTYAAFKKRGLIGFDASKNAWVLYEAMDYLIDDPVFHNEAKLNGDSSVTEGHRIEDVLRDGCYYAGYDRQTCYSCGEKVHFTVNQKYDYIAELTNDKKKEEGWLQFNIPVGLSDKLGWKKNGRGLCPAYHVRVLKKTKQKQIKDKDFNIYETYALVLNKTNTDEAKMLLEKLETIRKTHEGYVPVWYQTVSSGNGGTEKVYFSASSIGRIPQIRKWKEIMGDYGPCKPGKIVDENKEDAFKGLCPACLLFGMVNSNGRKGRLRFTDALPIKNNIEPKEIDLPILSSPRPSAFEFYLRKPNFNASYWNYDFYIEGSGFKAKYRELVSVTPRGRKMYWHGTPQKMLEVNKTDKNRHLYTTMETLEANEKNNFYFKIYFDNVTQSQLQQLQWVITLGENKQDGVHWHKIGHGKPVGYGSVKLTIEKTTIRNVKIEENGAMTYYKHPMSESITECPWGEGEAQPERIKAILAMTDSHRTRGENVKYPCVHENGDVFEWFADNRKNPNTLLTLPNPTDDVISLPASHKKEVIDTYRNRLNPNEKRTQRETQNNKPSPGKGRLTGIDVTGRVKSKNKNGTGYYIKLPDGECDGYLNISSIRNIDLSKNDSVLVHVLEISTFGTYDVKFKRKK